MTGLARRRRSLRKVLCNLWRGDLLKDDRLNDVLSRSDLLRGGLVAVVVASCGGGEAATRTPACPAVAAQPAATSPTHECTRAKQLRERVPSLLAEGRLDRTLKVIAAANTLCPAQRGESLQVELETLLKVGRYDEARTVSIELSGDDEIQHWSASDTLSWLASLGSRTFPEDDAARVEMREKFATAAATEALARQLSTTRSAEEVRRLHAKASSEFIDAWTSWRPQGEALYRAGSNAKLAGELTLAQGFFDRAVVELEQTTGRKVHAVAPLPPTESSAIAWSPTGTELAVAADEEVVLLDVGTWREHLRLPGEFGDPVRSLTFSPDGAHLLAGRKLWRVRDGGLLRVLDYTQELHFALDGGALTLGHQNERAALDWSDKRAACALEGVFQGSESFVLSPDGKLLVATRADGSAGFFDTHTCTLLRTAPEPWLQHVAFAPNSELVALAYETGGVVLLRARDGQLVRRLDHDFRVAHVQFSPDGKRLATLSSTKLRLWTVSDGKLERTLVHETFAVPLAFSPDSAQLAVIDETLIRVSNVDDGTPSRVIDARRGPLLGGAFSADGKALVVRAAGANSWGRSGDHQAVEAWRWELSGDHVWRRLSRAEFQALDANAQRRVVSPDSNLVFTIDDATIRVHPSGDGEPSILFVRPAAGLNAALVSTPDGKWDFNGPDASAAEAQVRCRVGSWSLPFELCRERFYAPNLAKRVLSRDPTLLEP